MKLEQAVIFCGGRGERLRPLTDNCPKPMVRVNCGALFIDYLLETLANAGITKVLFLTGYKKELFPRYFNQVKHDRIKEFNYSEGSVEDLTGRRLLNAYDQLDDHFLLCYGDNYLPEIPLEDMKILYLQRQVTIQTTVFTNKQGTGEYKKENNIRVENTCARFYDKSRKESGLNAVDIGYFIVDKKVLDCYELCTRNFSFEEEVLATYAQMGWLSAYDLDQQYYWITHVESLKKFEDAVKVNNFKPIEWRK